MRVFCRRNHRGRNEVQEVTIDPFRAISLVASKGDRPGNGFAVPIQASAVGIVQEWDIRVRFVILSGGEVKVEGMTVAIAQDVDFCAETTAGTP